MNASEGENFGVQNLKQGQFAPSGMNWYVESKSKSGLAHLFSAESFDHLVAECGRTIEKVDKQDENKAVGYCSRCKGRALKVAA